MTMKKSILFFLFALPLLGFAQDVDSKGIHFNSSDSLFYQYTRTDFEAGGYSINVKPIGDSAAVGNLYKDKIASLSRSMATDAKAVERFQKGVVGFISIGAEIESIVGPQYNPLKSIAADKLPELTDTLYQWQIKINGGDFYPIEFSLTGAGQLRHQADTFAKKNAFIFGDVIRLNQLFGLGNYDLFKKTDSRWESLDQSVVMRKVKADSNRAVMRSEAMSFKSVMAEPVITKQRQNSLLIDGVYYTLKPGQKSWTINTPSGKYRISIR